MSEQAVSLGRIEVAPEVMIMIAQAAVESIDGVSRMAPAAHDVGRLFRRSAPPDGVVLDIRDGRLIFDVYVLMKPDVNLLECSRAVQAAVVEAVDKMVGVPVEAVNVHVEDVVYQ